MYSKYSRRAVSLVGSLPLLFLPTVLTGQSVQDNLVPLKNWAAPLYWQPSHAEMAERAERESAAGITPKLQFSASQVSPSALTFIAVTPCRLVDTRGAAAGFNGLSPFSGPSLAPSSTVTFPVQSAAEASADTTPTPCGTIPSIAQAYSFNITVVPKTAGGIAFVTVWPSGGAQPAVSTLNDGQGAILANAAIVPAGTPSGGVNVVSSGPATMDLIIDMNGFYAAPSDLNSNTAIGAGALLSNAAGSDNTALGSSALGGPTNVGADNTAVGSQALSRNTNGHSNTALGSFALMLNTIGIDNTAIGQEALHANVGGSGNTAIGLESMESNTTGNSNIALGFQAGFNLTTGSNNIVIGDVGNPGEASTTRIGNISQLRFFAGGIRGITTGSNDAVPVMIDSAGQLGTVSSSRRYKEDIEDMGEASRDLMRLRPVTFRYKKAFGDGSKPVQYGLIAEEVDEVYPDLVAHSADGQIETVKYQVLDSMLLNEVQKQQSEIGAQKEQLQQLAREITEQREQNQSLQERLAKLEAALGATPGEYRHATRSPASEVGSRVSGGQ
jgi:endosialidase-like protein